MKNILIKLACLILALIMTFSVVGCKDSEGDKNNSSSEGQVISNDDDASDDYEDESEEDLDEESEDDWDDWDDDFEDDYDDYFDEDLEDDYDLEEDYEDDGDYFDEDEDDGDVTFRSARALIKNGSDPIQENFLGFNAVYHGFALMSDKTNRTHTRRQAEAEWDAVQKAGINVVRSYFDYSWSYQKVGTDWVLNLDDDEENNQKMWAFYEYCRGMQKRGIDVHVSYWWGVRQLYPQKLSKGVWEDTTASTGPFYTETNGVYDREKTIDKYAEYMEQLFTQFYALGLYNVKYWSFATEPGFNAAEEFTEQEHIEQATIIAEYVYAPIKRFHERLTTAGIRQNVNLMGPMEATTIRTGNNNQSYVMRAMYKMDKENQILDYYSSHSYVVSGEITEDNYYTMDTDIKYKLDAINNEKNKFIYDEYNYLLGYGSTSLNARMYNAYTGTAVAQLMVAFLNNGIKGSYLWTISDQQWPDNSSSSETDNFYDGVHKYGLLPNFQFSNVPYKGFYAFQLIARYMGVEGSKIYQGDLTGDYEFEQVYSAMVEHPDGNISIVVVNTDIMTLNLEMNFEKALGKTLYKHEFDPSIIVATEDAELITASAKITNCQDSFVDVIHGSSVIVYTTKKD